MSCQQMVYFSKSWSRQEGLFDYLATKLTHKLRSTDKDKTISKNDPI
jgi:hypothetical protein